MNALRHDFPAGVGHNRRCAICDCEDHEALVEKLADDLWESRRTGHLDDVPWADCGDYWQRIFREFAASAIESLRAGG